MHEKHLCEIRKVYCTGILKIFIGERARFVWKKYNL